MWTFAEVARGSRLYWVHASGQSLRQWLQCNIRESARHPCADLAERDGSGYRPQEYWLSLAYIPPFQIVFVNQAYHGISISDNRRVRGWAHRRRHMVCAIIFVQTFSSL